MRSDSRASSIVWSMLESLKQHNDHDLGSLQHKSYLISDCSTVAEYQITFNVLALTTYQNTQQQISMQTLQSYKNRQQVRRPNNLNNCKKISLSTINRLKFATGQQLSRNFFINYSLWYSQCVLPIHIQAFISKNETFK